MVALLLVAALQDEDPRAKAVREAYEEQLRRERVLPGFRIGFGRIFVPEGLDRLSANDALTFLKMWGAGEEAYTELIEGIQPSDLEEARSSVHQLNRLTGRCSELPTKESCERVRAAWKAWLRGDPCGHSDVDVRRLIRALGDEAPEARVEAERALEPCARRHRKVIEEAHRDEKDVEARARLQWLTPSDMGKAERDTLKGAHELIVRGEGQKALEMLRAARFPASHARTLELVIAGLGR